MPKQNIARFIQSLRFTRYAMHASDLKKKLVLQIWWGNETRRNKVSLMIPQSYSSFYSESLKWLLRFCSFKVCDVFQEVYSVDQILKSKSVDWFLNHRSLSHERVNLLDSVLNLFKVNMKKFHTNFLYLCPLKITGNLCFLTFSGAIEMQHWCEMVWRTSSIWEFYWHCF